jgi:murein DD-endopeptidase MepM/ murein hydrolase activator NlpD
MVVIEMKNVHKIKTLSLSALTALSFLATTPSFSQDTYNSQLLASNLQSIPPLPDAPSRAPYVSLNELTTSVDTLMNSSSLHEKNSSLETTISFYRPEIKIEDDSFQGKFYLPLDKTKMISAYGNRYSPDPKNKTATEFHGGIDFKANYGDPVYASFSGKVKKTTSGGGYGNYVVIDHGATKDKPKENIETLYAHLQNYVVRPGDTVVTGQLIGYAGSTGRSFGPHLHFEYFVNGKKQDPTNKFILPQESSINFKDELYRIKPELNHLPTQKLVSAHIPYESSLKEPQLTFRPESCLRPPLPETKSKFKQLKSYVFRRS